MDENRVNAESVATDLPAWDEAAALEVTGDNPDLARELVQMLVRGLPQDLSDLRRCFQAKDWPLLTATAHRMRGATSYCGVPALDARLKALEDSAKAGDRERSVWGHLGRIGTLVVLLLGSGTASAQGYGFVAPGEYAAMIHRTDFSLYPFIRVYLRTFDDKMQPLPDLNEDNILLLIQGRPYDPMKMQFGIQSIRGRREATRSVFVIDASRSMGHATQGVESQAHRPEADTPFEEMLRAVVRFIEGKRPQDEVAVLAVRDTKEGYAVVSRFERDGKVLARRLAAIRADGLKTRLYDATDAALRMCGTSPEGSNPVASCSVLVMSDGKDEGSAITREELMTRITDSPTPYPIYSLAYSRTSREHFKNLEALSQKSFGIYYMVGEAPSGMRRIVEKIRNMLYSDYVVTLRSYLPVDGAKHDITLGVEAPSGSGNYAFDNSFFKAVRQSFTREVEEAKSLLAKKIEKLPDGAEPYYY